MENGKIEDISEIGQNLNTDFIEGVIHHQDEFILALKLDKLFSLEELKKAEETAKTGKKNKKTEQPVE